jgi:hypothetical protein
MRCTPGKHHTLKVGGPHNDVAPGVHHHRQAAVPEACRAGTKKHRHSTVRNASSTGTTSRRNRTQDTSKANETSMPASQPHGSCVSSQARSGKLKHSEAASFQSQGPLWHCRQRRSMHAVAHTRRDTSTEGHTVCGDASHGVLIIHDSPAIGHQTAILTGKRLVAHLQQGSQVSQAAQPAGPTYRIPKG